MFQANFKWSFFNLPQSLNCYCTNLKVLLAYIGAFCISLTVCGACAKCVDSALSVDYNVDLSEAIAPKRPETQFSFKAQTFKKY